MTTSLPTQGDDQHPPKRRALRWIPPLSGLITSVTALLLFLTGNIEAITPVAALGAAVAGGTAIQVHIRIRN